MKKKIVFLFLIVFFLGTTNLVANNFSDCLMRERLKARAKGFSLDSAIRHSLKFCNSKFIKRKKPKQKLGRPYFGLDLITGSKRVCGTNCGKIEEKKLHSTNGVIVDIFITSGWSFSGGILKSMSKKYPYQNGIVSTQAILKTEERTYGIKFHLKASDKSGLDLYLGGGIALLIARKTADDLGEVEKNAGSGQYIDGGFKYVSQLGWSFGYYVRQTSSLFQFEEEKQNLGGLTSGISVGWTF